MILFVTCSLSGLNRFCFVRNWKSLLVWVHWKHPVLLLQVLSSVTSIAIDEYCSGRLCWFPFLVETQKVILGSLAVVGKLEHDLPCLGFKSKDSSSFSKFQEKSDSVGVVPVHPSPTVSNLYWGHIRKQCKTIIWGPRITLITRNCHASAFPVLARQTQCSVLYEMNLLQSIRMKGNVSMHYFVEYVEATWSVHEANKIILPNLIVVAPTLDTCTWGFLK